MSVWLHFHDFMVRNSIREELRTCTDPHVCTCSIHPPSHSHFQMSCLVFCWVLLNKPVYIVCLGFCSIISQYLSSCFQSGLMCKAHKNVHANVYIRVTLCVMSLKLVFCCNSINMTKLSGWIELVLSGRKELLLPNLMWNGMLKSLHVLWQIKL